MVEHAQTIRRQIADELFECVWPFHGIGTWRVNGKSILVKIDAPEKFDKNTSCWTKEIFGR